MTDQEDMMGGRCQDCRYWLRNESATLESWGIVLYDPNIGVCAKTMSDTASGDGFQRNTTLALANASVWSRNGGADMDYWLETRAQFGCVQFEP